MTRIDSNAQRRVRQNVRAATNAGLGSFLSREEIGAMLDGTVSRKNIHDVSYARLGAVTFNHMSLAYACEDLERALAQSLNQQNTFANLWEGVKDAFV